MMEFRCSSLSLIVLSIALSLILSPSLSASPLEIVPQSTTANETVHEILADFGLPKGLLPDSVKSYSLSEDGRFVVELQKPCYVHFEYLVYYDRKIIGVLKYGSITKLSGIEVKKLFLWLNVDEIRVDLPPNDSIYFQVGWINKKLDVDQFQTVRSCQDNAVVGEPCGGGSSWTDLLKVTEPLREIQALLTE